MKQHTSISGKGRATWTLLLGPGGYTFRSSAPKSKLAGSFKVTTK